MHADGIGGAGVGGGEDVVGLEDVAVGLGAAVVAMCLGIGLAQLLPAGRIEAGCDFVVRVLLPSSPTYRDVRQLRNRLHGARRSRLSIDVGASGEH